MSGNVQRLRSLGEKEDQDVDFGESNTKISNNPIWGDKIIIFFSREHQEFEYAITKGTLTDN